MTEPRLHFLGWDEPPLPRAAAWLLGERGPDLGRLVVVTPGRRAGRRLLDLLVAAATAPGGPGRLVPPRIVTAGALPELLFRTPVPPASRSARLLAWTRCLQGEVSAEDGGDVDLDALLARAIELCRVQDELGGAGLRLDQVVERGGEALDPPEEGRWMKLGELACEVEQRLARAGVEERGTARLRWLAQGPGRAAGVSEVVFCAVVEISELVERLLDLSGTPTTRLIAAPAFEQAEFDERGGLRVERWMKRRLPGLVGKISIRDRPLELARHVAEELASRGQDERRVTLGVPGAALSRHLERSLTRLGVPHHTALGRPLGETEPWPLLEVLASFLERRRWADLAELVRHPDLEEALASALTDSPDGAGADSLRPFARAARSGDVATVIDLYGAETCAATWVGATPPGPPEMAAAIRVVGEELARALGMESLEDAGAARPLRDQVAALRRFAEALYGGRRFGETDGQPGTAARALAAVGEALADLEDAARDAGPPVTLSQTVRLLRASAPGEILPADGEGGVEIVGWLECALDDAPEALILGMNEGMVPEWPAMDPYLTPRLRRRLGLADERSRYARDLYYLTLLEHSRDVHLFAARRNDEEEPLAPSRLLLAAGARQRAEAIVEFYRRDESEPEAAAPEAAAGGGLRLVPPASPDRSLERLRATAFRDYLRCPYRFWLRHVLRLEAAERGGGELDPGRFGRLLHDVLRDFASGPAAASAREAVVRAALEELLDERARGLLGSRPRAAVRLQLEQARRRLGAVARWQAEERAAGWEIVPGWVERPVERELTAAGTALVVVGRIDRLDRHEKRGYRLLDYKTSERGLGPERTHRETGGGTWRDLQLPLYLWLARGEGLEGPLQGGFVNLAPDLRAPVLALAEWSEAELEDALDAARGVVEDVGAGRFWPPGPAPGFDDGLVEVAGDRLWNQDDLVSVSGP